MSGLGGLGADQEYTGLAVEAEARPGVRIVGDGEEATRRLWGEAHLKVLPGGYVCRETDGVNTADRYIRVALVHD